MELTVSSLVVALGLLKFDNSILIVFLFTQVGHRKQKINAQRILTPCLGIPINNSMYKIQGMGGKLCS